MNEIKNNNRINVEYGKTNISNFGELQYCVYDNTIYYKVLSIDTMIREEYNDDMAFMIRIVLEHDNKLLYINEQSALQPYNKFSTTNISYKDLYIAENGLKLIIEMLEIYVPTQMALNAIPLKKNRIPYVPAKFYSSILNEVVIIYKTIILKQDKELKDKLKQCILIDNESQINRNVLTTFRDTAKLLDIRENKLIELLIKDEYLISDTQASTEYIPFLFQIKEYTTNNKFTNTKKQQILVTPQGRKLFNRIYNNIK